MGTIDGPTFGELQYVHLARYGAVTTACNLAVYRLGRTDRTQLERNVTCPNCREQAGLNM